MKNKRLIISMLTVVMILMLSVSVMGAIYWEHQYTIDNDDAQGYSNNKNGFDTWFQDSNLYYGDARIQECEAVNGYYYSYIYSQYSRYTDIKARITAYLYNIDFTDPYASYRVNDYLSTAYAIAGYMNQDLASPGWNMPGTATVIIPSPEGRRYTYFAAVFPSVGNNDCYCGADAFFVKLGYDT